METGIIVARFQIHTLHKGHRTLIETVIKNHKRVIIFLGVTEVATRKNPLNYKNRELMVSALYPNVEVYPLCDHPSNEGWVENLENTIEELVPKGGVILYGSRDSCIETYIKHGGKLTAKTLLPDENFNATEIRDAVAKEIVDNDDFRRGIIYAQYNNNYPTAFATVDVIATREYNNEIEILLGQKPYEVGKDLWRLPGGFMDPTDKNGRETASRELREETCISASPDIFQIIEQVKINDWRYKRTENGIMTTIYSVHIGAGWHDKVICNQAKASDDLAKVKWFKLSELRGKVIDAHEKGIEMFVNHPYFQLLQENIQMKKSA